MGLSKEEAEIVKAMADNDLVANRVANQIYMHRNSVIYWVESIKKKTGLDCRKFYDMVKLLEMVEEE